MPTITALSVARPLVAELATRPFDGRVGGIFNRACNLMDEAGRILVLALPQVGNGPLSVVISRWEPGLLAALSSGEPVHANFQSLQVGEWQITWRDVPAWEARVARPDEPVRLSPAVAGVLGPYLDWPGAGSFPPVAAGAAAQARHAAARLRQALSRTSPREAEIAEAAGRLAGLGSGLTPAGDDYLTGVMVALWLAGQTAVLPVIARVAAPKTTTLSACFLWAAARGEFVEPWHGLARAVVEADAPAAARAAAQIARSGASSGRDALAGFAAMMGKVIPVS